MLKWLVLGVALIAAAIVSIVVVGTLLPREHIASRRATYQPTPEFIFDILVDFEGTSSWRPDIERVELSSHDDPVRYREHGDHGPILYEVVSMDKPHRLVTRIADDALPYSGSWTFVLEPDGDATRLTITEMGAVDNPVFRFFSKFVFSHTATMDAYLKALGEKLGEEVEPVDGDSETTPGALS